MARRNTNSTKERLRGLEVSMKDIKEALNTLKEETRIDFRAIRDNHLEKIYKKLDDLAATQIDLERLIWKRPGWIITSLCTLLGALIVYILTTR